MDRLKIQFDFFELNVINMHTNLQFRGDDIFRIQTSHSEGRNPRELCLHMISILNTVLIIYLLTLDGAWSNASNHHVSINAKMLIEKCWLAYSQNSSEKLEFPNFWVFKLKILKSSFRSRFVYACIRSLNFQKFQNSSF